MKNNKLISKQLNLSSIDNIQIEYNKMFMILPTPIVDKLIDLNNYSNFKWFTNIKKSSVDDNHIKTLDRINKLIIILRGIYDRNKANDAGKYIYNFQYKKTDFRKLFSADACDTYMAFLAKIGLVNKCEDSTYSAGKFAYTYRMSKELFEGQTYSMIFNMQNNYNVETNTEILYTHYNDDIKIDNRMKITLDVVKINKADAISDEVKYFIKNNYKIDVLAHRINNILNFGSKKYLSIGKKVNRLYHHITNLSAIARKHLNIKFKYVDITNCQPTLLSYVMKKEAKQIDTDYIKSVEDGCFYEQFMFLNNNDRNATKVAIYRDILFDFKTYSDTNKHFKVLFPLVWKYLNEVNQNKEKSGQTLASILQNIETDIFKDVPSVCENSGYLFTLHDSIYFDNDNDEQPVKDHLTKKFAEYGLQVNFNNN